MEEDLMLELRGISRNYYWTPVVKDINFNVQRGEIVGYLGPDGAGKTTTAKIMAGLLSPTGGGVYLDGEEMSTDTVDYKRRVGYVPSESDIYFHLSGFEYLMLVGRLARIPEDILHERIDYLFVLLGLGVETQLPMSSFARETRQKIMLAAAMLHEPEVLVLDESFTGMDDDAAGTFQTILEKIAAMGMMIVYCSNDVNAIEAFCSRVVVIDKGEVIAEDTVDHLDLMKTLPSLEPVFGDMVHPAGSVDVPRFPVFVMRAG